MDPQESAPSGRSKALREALASGVADLGVPRADIPPCGKNVERDRRYA